VATVPAPHDPDSFIKEFGGEAFRQLIEKSDGFFDYYLSRLCATNDITTDKGRSAVVKAMAEAVQKTGDSVVLGTYAQKTAARLGVPPALAHAEFKKTSRMRPEPTERTDDEAEQPVAARPPNEEFWLLKLVLRHDELIDALAAHLKLDWIVHPGARRILTLRLAAFADQNWSGPASLLGELDDDSTRSLATEAMAEERELPNPTQQLGDILTRLRNQLIDRQLAELTQRLHHPNLAEADQLALLHEQQALRQLKRQPLG